MTCTLTLNRESNKMNITNASEMCLAIARSKGFYEDYERVLSKLTDKKDQDFFIKIWRSHRLMLIVSELGEALEALRDDNMSTTPKSGGFGEELVDTLVRLLDLFGHLGIETAAALDAKMVYNNSRPYKHNRQL